MKDTILRDGIEIEAILLGAPCRSLGARTDLRAKGGCETGINFMPVYRCLEYRLCSPFGSTSDLNLIHPCQGCPRYKNKFDFPPN